MGMISLVRRLVHHRQEHLASGMAQLDALSHSYPPLGRQTLRMLRALIGRWSH